MPRGSFEEGYAGGESVDEVFSTDRPEFSLGEKACQRDRSHSSLDCFGIVIWLREQTGSATVATEEQCRVRGIWVRRPILIEQLDQILVGCGCVTNVELHRLTDADQIPDHDRPVVGSSPDDVGNQKVSPCKALLIFVHHDAQVKPAL